MLPPERIKEICQGIFKNYILAHQAVMASKGPVVKPLVGMAMNEQLNRRIAGGIGAYQEVAWHDIDRRVGQIIEKEKLDVQPNSPEYAHLKEGMRRVMAEWEHYLNDYNTGNVETAPKDNWFAELYPHFTPAPMPVQLKDVTVQTDVVSNLMALHLAEDAGKDKSKQKKQAAADWFVDLIGDKQIHQVTKEDARKFKDGLRKMPKNAKQRYPDKSASELVQLPLKAEELISTTSVNSYLIAMGTLFNWAKKNFDKVGGDNPFEGMGLKEAKNKKDKRRAFSDAELKVIFESPIYRGCRRETQRYVAGPVIVKDSKYWIPLLALFTGARLNELCQLYVGDVYQQDSVWVLDINQNGNDKGLKTEAAKRKIPLHPQLVALGFLDYVTSQKGANSDRLFPDVSLGVDGTYSHTFSKQFGYALRTNLGIKDKDATFHSFRHTFVDALRHVDTVDSVMKAIVGHEDASVTAGYGSAEMMKRMHGYIAKVGYPIDWS